MPQMTDLSTHGNRKCGVHLTTGTLAFASKTLIYIGPSSYKIIVTSLLNQLLPLQFGTIVAEAVSCDKLIEVIHPRDTPQGVLSKIFSSTPLTGAVCWAYHVHTCMRNQGMAMLCLVWSFMTCGQKAT